MLDAGNTIELVRVKLAKIAKEHHVDRLFIIKLKLLTSLFFNQLEQKLGDLQETVEKSSEENDARTKVNFA